jgi:uncharacterized protein YsxB (DUF464 family)
MAQGDLRGNLTASVASVTNPTNLTGSVAVSLRDLIFVAFSQQTALTATTVTDNLGNTYTAINAGTDAGTATLRCYRAPVTVAGTLTQISVAATASTNDASGVAAVIEGPFFAAPLDANPANTSDATTPFTCPATGTLAQAEEVIIAAIGVGANTTVAATSPFTLSGTVARANISTGVSRQKVSATTTQTPEFTGTSATAVQTTASFKLAKIITAAADSYALTGTAASLERGFEVVADAGSYALTGSAAGLAKGLRFPVDAGSYALTGSAASLERGFEVLAEAGSYAVTGTAANLELGREVLADAGSYALTGTAASLEYGFEVVPDAGSYALTGTAALLERGFEVAAEAGSYALTGTAAALEYGFEVTADPGSYALTGQDVTLTYTPSAGAINFPVDAGSYALTGTDATLTKGTVSTTLTGFGGWWGYSSDVKSIDDTRWQGVKEAREEARRLFDERPKQQKKRREVVKAAAQAVTQTVKAVEKAVATPAPVTFDQPPIDAGLLDRMTDLIALLGQYAEAERIKQADMEAARQQWIEIERELARTAFLEEELMIVMALTV